MIVRELEKQERKYALDIIWSVFCMDVAEVYEQEGIDTFREYLKQENIDQLCDNGELLMFGVFDQEELEGTISLHCPGLSPISPSRLGQSLVPLPIICQNLA